MQQSENHFLLVLLSQPSCYSCIRVNTLKTTTDAVIDKLSNILRETGLPNDVGKHNDLFKADAQIGPIFKCQLPGLDYVLFVRGSGPHDISYQFTEDRPLKEVIVSRKCAEAVLRGAQVHSYYSMVYTSPVPVLISIHNYNHRDEPSNYF